MAIGEFTREVLAGFVANMFLRRGGAAPGGVSITETTMPLVLTPEERRELDVLLEGLGIGQSAIMRDPIALTLITVNQAVKVLADNAARKRYLVQYVSAGGEARVHTSQTIDGGIKILPDGAWIDEVPFVHAGEVWVHATVANAIVIVTEWA